MAGEWSTIGMCFHPHDQDLLRILRWKEENKPIPPMVIEREMYGKNAAPWMMFKEDDPWQPMVESYGELVEGTKLLYVITELKKRSKSKIERVAGEGTWNAKFVRDVNEILNSDSEENQLGGGRVEEDDWLSLIDF